MIKERNVFQSLLIEYKGKLFVRGIHEGQEFQEKIDFPSNMLALGFEIKE